jgi:hypothetical protein
MLGQTLICECRSPRHRDHPRASALAFRAPPDIAIGFLSALIIDAPAERKTQ